MPRIHPGWGKIIVAPQRAEQREVGAAREDRARSGSMTI
jgi:hypothetical protein